MQQNTVIRCSTGTASENCEHMNHDGYDLMKRTMRTLAPKACGGRLEPNFDLTTPLLPCGRVTRLLDYEQSSSAWRVRGPYPQITRTFDPAISRLAR
jgi:hypothetical protein